MMNVNATIIGQVITFAIFIWFVMKFVWPPLIKMMEERKAAIADGLAAAEKGHRDAELADIKAKETLTEAKAKAAQILEQAEKRANQVVEASKQKAHDEGARLIEMAQGEIEQQVIAARAELMQEVSALAISGAEKILNAEVDKATNARLVDEMMKEA